jgi:hypothetical protein
MGVVRMRFQSTHDPCLRVCARTHTVVTFLFVDVTESR